MVAPPRLQATASDQTRCQMFLGLRFPRGSPPHYRYVTYLILSLSFALLGHAQSQTASSGSVTGVTLGPPCIVSQACCLPYGYA